jgi:hypothetical protein
MLQAVAGLVCVPHGVWTYAARPPFCAARHTVTNAFRCHARARRASQGDRHGEAGRDAVRYFPRKLRHASRLAGFVNISVKVHADSFFPLCVLTAKHAHTQAMWPRNLPPPWAWEGTTIAAV